MAAGIRPDPASRVPRDSSFTRKAAVGEMKSDRSFIIRTTADRVPGGAGFLGLLTLPTSGLVYADAQIAILAATALIHGSVLFVTNDTGFRRVPGLRLAILDDILAR